MIKPTSRKTVVSNTNNMEVCDRHARHRSGTYYCTLHTNLPLVLFSCLVQNSIERVQNLLLTVEGTKLNYNCNMAKQSAMTYV